MNTNSSSPLGKTRQVSVSVSLSKQTSLWVVRKHRGCKSNLVRRDKDNSKTCSVYAVQIFLCIQIKLLTEFGKFTGTPKLTVQLFTL